MIAAPLDVLTQFPIRKTRQQKQAFREAAVAYAREKGYAVTVETGKRDVQNIVIGDPERAKYLVTAHYDTPVCIGIANFCAPCNRIRSRLMFFASMILSAGVTSSSMLLFRAGYPIAGSVLLLVVLGLLLMLEIAPANRNNANDNTSGVVTVLEILATIPENLRQRVCFVLFDLEENGKKGSAAYRKAHQTATEGQIVLNLDCVGDGDHILLMPEKKARQDRHLLCCLGQLEDTIGKKEIRLIDRGYCRVNSDQIHFPLGVAIGAYHKEGRDYTLGRIHTKRDTVLEYTNVNILRAAIISLIGQP